MTGISTTKGFVLRPSMLPTGRPTADTKAARLCSFRFGEAEVERTAYGHDASHGVAVSPSTCGMITRSKLTGIDFRRWGAS
jgi:hypothetical protein